jgi:hypothetical protein
VTKTRRRNQSAAAVRLARQGADVLALSPTVAAGRMMRLAAQRPAAAATALGTMGLEKMTTFAQAWTAMATAGMQAQFKFAMSMWAPRTFGSARAQAGHAGSELADALMSMASSAMKPVHARVKRNAGKRKRN